jgi:hypothetical protein
MSFPFRAREKRKEKMNLMSPILNRPKPAMPPSVLAFLFCSFQFTVKAPNNGLSIKKFKLKPVG